MFHLLRGRRQLDDRVAAHRLTFIHNTDSTFAVLCDPSGCGHAISGCDSIDHAREQHTAYARHVEAGHIGRGKYLPDMAPRGSVPAQLSPLARRIY